MRKKLFVTVIAILALAFIAIYYFFSGTKETELLSKVPMHAKSILVIDVKGLSTRLLVDELSSDEKSAGKLAEMLPDSLKEIDFSNSGINLLDKAVLFTTELNSDIWVNLLLPISDYKKFTDFKDSLIATGEFTEREKGNFLISQKYKLVVNWNKDFVHVSNCTFYPVNSVSGLIETLNLPKNLSILTDSVFMRKLSRDYDFFLYAKPFENHPEKGTEIISSNITRSFSYIKFYDGELEINSEIELKKGSLVDSLLSIKRNPVNIIQSDDSTSFTASLNVEAKPFFQFLEQFSAIKFNKDKIPLLNVWNGSASLLLNPSEFIENEFISYEFDDNFNKVEVKKITREKVSDIQLNFGIDNAENTENKNFLKEGKDTLLFKGANFIVKGNGESFICYNKHLEKPQLTTETSNASLKIGLNYEMFLPVLNDYNIKTDSLFLNKFGIKNIDLEANRKENLDIKLKVFFKKEDKNAFFIIAEKLE